MHNINRSMILIIYEGVGRGTPAGHTNERMTALAQTKTTDPDKSQTHTLGLNEKKKYSRYPARHGALAMITVGKIPQQQQQHKQQ